MARPLAGRSSQHPITASSTQRPPISKRSVRPVSATPDSFSAIWWRRHSTHVAGEEKSASVARVASMPRDGSIGMSW